MPKNKNKKFKPIPYRDFPSSTDRIPQPKGKFVNPFRAMRVGWAEAEREAEATHAWRQDKAPSNRSADSATHKETNPMPKNKKRKYISYSDFIRTHDELPQPKGKFVNPFKIMRDRQAAEREAEAARSRQQDQNSE